MKEDKARQGERERKAHHGKNEKQGNRPEVNQGRRGGIEEDLVNEKGQRSFHTTGRGREGGVGRLDQGMRGKGREGEVEGWDHQKDEGNPGEEGLTPGHDPEGRSGGDTARKEGPADIDTVAESGNGRADPGIGGIDARRKALREMRETEHKHYCERSSVR